MTPAEAVWGVDSEHGRLLDVLVCRPESFRWRATSAITEATLDAGHRFDAELAAFQHAALVSAYEDAGVRCHFLEPDPALHYQVFTRDSSTMGPNGTVVTQPAQWWRRGEYAPVIRFHQEGGIPIRGMITAGSLEGGDVMIVEPGSVLIGAGETRTQEHAARQLAEWFREDGWEARVQPIPERYVHIDVLVAVLGEKLAAVCSEVLPAAAVEWLRGKGFDLIEVSAEQAFTLGVNAISLGDERVISGTGAVELNAALRDRGLAVIELDLSMFTLGGGGPHCMSQALRRERVG
ncbi:MAG TPA: arginine deiminase family protein [Solirubrobacterales bacterium]|nr:arginine deiminase family protein [Solirubrobacterales bacterium]